MDGLLIVDKPPGPTSHDVVARVRRILRERRIGHTGTLDPMASGVLPLVVGRATRLARFLNGDKSYEATIRLGINTDSYDATGQVAGTPFAGMLPSVPEIETALDLFRGTFTQRPPAFSAKKIAGRRSYALARQARSAGGRMRPPVVDEPSEGSLVSPPSENSPVFPSPVNVTTHAIDLLAVEDDLVRLHVECSAGFYIRSLAFDLGAALGTGAHLIALRRTTAADFGLDAAVPLDQLGGEAGADIAASALIPMERMLASLPAVSLTAGGLESVRVGRDLGPTDVSAGFLEAVSEAGGAGPTAIRVLDPAGRLVAVASAAERPGLLHPAVVLL
jgi:tRNA pseudouridine55 synthase